MSLDLPDGVQLTDPRLRRATPDLQFRRKRITLAQRQTLLESFSASLRGYTYYED